MRAITHSRYGSPDVLSLSEVPAPDVPDDRVLVRVRAVAMNPLDWHFLTGTPYFLRLIAGLRRPKRTIPGVDIAGVVERVGSGVTGFDPGDEVFGSAPGGCAELVLAKPDRIVALPEGLRFEQAAAVPVAAVTALQGLRDRGGVQPGQRVLVNGASGGVGTFAVQLAKWMGAHVTGVCSTPNLELVRSLGADAVVDYTREDFTAVAGDDRYDVILDNVGNRNTPDIRRALAPDGIHVIVSGPKENKLLGPVVHVVASKLRFAFHSQRVTTFTAHETAEELELLSGLLVDGTLVPVIDRTYPLADTADAIRYLAEGHARGKVVVTIGS